jgi:hypothetical protein
MSGNDERRSSAICLQNLGAADFVSCIESDPFNLGTLIEPYLVTGYSDPDNLIQAPEAEVILLEEIAS